MSRWDGWGWYAGANAPGTKRGRAAKAKVEANDVECAAPAVPKVAFGKIELASYDKPREELPALSFSFDAPVTHGAILRQLGVPASWSGDGSPADALAPRIRAAAEMARRIAMAEQLPAESGKRT